MAGKNAGESQCGSPAYCDTAVQALEGGEKQGFAQEWNDELKDAK